MLVRRAKETEKQMVRLRMSFQKKLFQRRICKYIFSELVFLFENVFNTCLSFYHNYQTSFIIHYWHFVHFQYYIYDHKSHIFACISDFFYRICSLNCNSWITGHCHGLWDLGSSFHNVILISLKQFHPAA